jgi:2-polyprenyl-3-methyl-5-hydroxy-6-metoxy-1,4-benzoquinol methylase
VSDPYDFFYPFYQAHYDHGLKDLFLDLIKTHTAPCSVLDIGCGPGLISLALSEAGYTVTATDISEVFLNALRLESAARKIPLTVATYDILTPPQTTYDCVIMVFDVINHLESLDQFSIAIRHAFQAVKESGLFIMDVLKATYLESLIGYQETFTLNEETLVWSVKEGALRMSVRHQLQKNGRIQSLNERTFSEETFVSLLPKTGEIKTIELEDRLIYLILKK